MYVYFHPVINSVNDVQCCNGYLRYHKRTARSCIFVRPTPHIYQYYLILCFGVFLKQKKKSKKHPQDCNDRRCRCAHIDVFPHDTKF